MSDVLLSFIVLVYAIMAIALSIAFMQIERDLGTDRFAYAVGTALIWPVFLVWRLYRRIVESL